MPQSLWQSLVQVGLFSFFYLSILCYMREVAVDFRSPVGSSCAAVGKVGSTAST